MHPKTLSFLIIILSLSMLMAGINLYLICQYQEPIKSLDGYMKGLSGPDSEPIPGWRTPPIEHEQWQCANNSGYSFVNSTEV